MYPHERSLVNEMKDKPFALVGVNSDGERGKSLEDIRKIVEEKEINWRSFQNKPEGATSTISAAWGVRGWPTLVVLDENMKIHYVGHNGNEAIELAKELVGKLSN